MSQGEIVIYKTLDNTEFQIDVMVQDETVWLNRQQIAMLFERDVKTIGKHINNSLNEELHGLPTVAKFAIVQKEGDRYIERDIEHYNLDVIISVGYRVKSQRGIQFRVWANKILKEYLLKGHAVQFRLEKIEDDVHNLKKKVDNFEIQVKTNLPPNEGIFYDGQIFDAYIFVSDIVRSAEKSVVLIDNFVDDTVLTLFSKRKSGVYLKILTKTISKQLALDVKKFNEQFPITEIQEFDLSHDRFMIIDNKTVYHIGASLKDLGKKWFAFSKMDIEIDYILKRIKNIQQQTSS